METRVLASPARVPAPWGARRGSEGRSRGVLSLALVACMGALSWSSCGGDATVPDAAGADVARSDTKAAAGARWISLAEGYRPPAALAGSDGSSATFDAWIAAPAQAWSTTEQGPAEGAPRWSTPHPEAGLPVRPDAELVLEVAGQEASFERVVRQTANMEGLDTATATEIVLAGERDAAPEDARFRVTLSAGVREGAAWRVVYDNRVAEGFALRPGESVAIPVEAPAGARILLEAGFAPFGGEVAGGEATGGEATGGDAPLGTPRLDVLADGVSLGAVELGRATERFEWKLTEAAGELRFEVVAGAGAAVVLTPGIALASVPGEGTTEATPRDVVLIVADTFRDDLLDTERDGAPLLPNLHALAEGGRRYPRVWAPAPWTLPSTASMLFGRYPYDHVAVDYDRRPREDLRSLADHLHSQGYRTAAVTEGVFVSRLYGMDRGFESFEECAPGDLASTLALARERLAADDGRPLFLLVHTYRTHAPYHVSEHVLANEGRALGATRTWDELIGTLAESVAMHLELAPGQAHEGDEWDVLLEFIDDDDWLATVEGLDEGASPAGVLGTLRGLYEATALELDRALGTLLDELAARPRPPLIAFTSDHGEAFGEHDRIFHGLGLWEELLRVPFVVHGPGVAPGSDPTPASLVDLPSTLCGWLGLAPDPMWAGRDLSRSDPSPDGVPLYAFDTERQAQPRIAVVDFPHKVGVAANPAAIEAGERLFAYDLAADPGETDDLADDPARALVNLLPVLRMLGAGSAQGPRVEVDEEQRRLLEALGYR